MIDKSAENQQSRKIPDQIGLRRHAKSDSAAAFLPDHFSLKSLREAEHSCQACDLYLRATHVIGGEGPANAKMMLVGEAPGDEEDKAGRPFVGPAGQLLDAALEAAEISRHDVFVTNAVKHFSWTPSGKRRLRAKPKAREISACRPWLESEIEVIKPKVIVCLGATTAQTLLGTTFRVTQQRGQPISTERGIILATFHPSAILRAPDPAVRDSMKHSLTDDLKTAAKCLG